MVKVELPPLLLFRGDWERYVEVLYQVYLDEVVNGNLTFMQFSVRCRYDMTAKEKGHGFWHLIQEGPEEENRVPDLKRCERIHWVSWMIRQVGSDPRITWWEEKRGTGADVLIWLEELEYVVVLSRRRRYFLLKTAYCTDKPHKKAALLKKRAEYWSANKS